MTPSPRYPEPKEIDDPSPRFSCVRLGRNLGTAPAKNVSPLLTKLEMSDSLTLVEQTGFEGASGRADRDEVWRRNRLYRSGVLGPEVAEQARVTIDLSDVILEEVINPENLTYNRSIPATAATGEVFAAAFARPPAAMAAR